MAGYRLTAEADADLSEIYEYSIENFGLAKAQAYLLGILGAFEILSDNRRLGRDIGHIKEGYRRYEHASHSIYYHLAGDGIRIARVLHASRDR